MDEIDLLVTNSVPSVAETPDRHPPESDFSREEHPAGYIPAVVPEVVDPFQTIEALQAQIRIPDSCRAVVQQGRSLVLETKQTVDGDH